jgi:hypothetical protein
MTAAHRVKTGAAIAGAVALLLVVPTSAPAAGPVSKYASARACARVVNPYPDTRYEGVDLKRIRATGVSCRRARRVARRAHRRALALPPPLTGVRRFTWHGWRVRGDLRGSHDRYVARRHGKRVTWRF